MDRRSPAFLTLGVGLRSREQPSYTHSFLLGDRFELPGGTRVGLRHLVGLKLQLIPYLMYPIPTEGDLVERKGRDLANSVTV